MTSVDARYNFYPKVSLNCCPMRSQLSVNLKRGKLWASDSLGTGCSTERIIILNFLAVLSRRAVYYVAYEYQQGSFTCGSECFSTQIVKGGQRRRWTNIFACFATELFHNVEWPIFTRSANRSSLCCSVKASVCEHSHLVFPIKWILHIRKVVTLMTILTIIRCPVLLALSITNEWWWWPIFPCPFSISLTFRHSVIRRCGDSCHVSSSKQQNYAEDYETQENRVNCNKHPNNRGRRIRIQERIPDVHEREM